MSSPLVAHANFYRIDLKNPTGIFTDVLVHTNNGVASENFIQLNLSSYIKHHNTTEQVEEFLKKKNLKVYGAELSTWTLRSPTYTPLQPLRSSYVCADWSRVGTKAPFCVDVRNYLDVRGVIEQLLAVKEIHHAYKKELTEFVDNVENHGMYATIQEFVCPYIRAIMVQVPNPKTIKQWLKAMIDAVDAYGPDCGMDELHLAFASSFGIRGQREQHTFFEPLYKLACTCRSPEDIKDIFYRLGVEPPEESYIQDCIFSLFDQLIETKSPAKL